MAEDTPLEIGSSRATGWNERLLMILAGALSIGLMTAGMTVLYGRANAEKSPDPFPPIAVETQPIEVREAYAVKERFVGLLEPARQTRLAFERSGLVTEILFDEGARVVKGDVVARMDDSKLIAERHRLEAHLEEQKARLDLATVTLSRQSALKAKGWQSEQKHDEARFAVAQLSSTIQGLQASIKSMDVDIAKSELKAPYSGTIGRRAVDEGAVVSPATPVIDLIEAQATRARIGVSLEASDTIRAGRAYHLVARGRVLGGVLIAKRPDLETGSRTVTLVFAVTGAEGVRFGEIVELAVERPVPERGAWLPLSALTEGSKGLWSVFTIIDGDRGPSVAREAVEVLHADGQDVYVRGNLAGGSHVVISGTNRIVPGQTVTWRPAGKES